MGNVIDRCNQSVRKVARGIYDTGKDLYDMGNGGIDYLSYDVMQEKPTIALAIYCMDMPVPEKDAVEAVLSVVYDMVGLVLVPAKAIIDKKFCTHVYQSNNMFMSEVGAVRKDTNVPYYEKMLIYVAKHSNDIIEPVRERMLCNIEIGDENYDVPVNLWYTIKVDIDKRLYFYIHISPTNGYRGILFAVIKEDHWLLEKIKEDAGKYYIKTLGRSSKSRQTISDIL